MPITEICSYLRIQYKYIGYNRPHPLHCPQFLQDQHKIERISCPVEGGARITGVWIREYDVFKTKAGCPDFRVSLADENIIMVLHYHALCACVSLGPLLVCP